MTEIGSALTSVLTWIGDTVSALFSTNGALAALFPYFVLSIAISVFLLGVSATCSATSHLDEKAGASA